MPETPMCAQRWAEVEFAKVPSLWAAAGSARRRVRRAREGRSGAESAPACMLLCSVVDDGSLLNEFALMWELRERFPLHFIVFKQTACHLSHEANVEQVSSRASGKSL